MAGGQCRFRTGGRSGVGLGIAATLFVTGSFSSSSSSDSSAPGVGLGCHDSVRILRGEVAGTYSDVGAMSNVFFDEEGPGVSSSFGTVITPGLVSNGGEVPASSRGGTVAGALGPFPFFLLEAKGSSLGFF